VPLPYSINIPVVNEAIGGRSARSYTVQGRFQAIVDAVKPGDFVVIEFGRNDGGNYSNPNGRPDCPGNDGETCWDPTSNTTVYTFHAYMVWAGRNLTEKGAHVIISSLVPTNPYEFGSFNYTPSIYVEYAKDAAKSIGRGATFVDHGAYVADRERWMNGTYVDTLYPLDHTHTNGEGADVVAKAFVKAVKCARGVPLARHVVNATRSIPGRCLH
jgi:rhamnogalacturonan acetylesterase